MLDSTVTRLIADGFFCRDCGHEDNERDPLTGQVIAPIHAMKVLTSSCGCPAHADLEQVTAVLEVATPRVELVSWCLICARPCSGDFRHRVRS
ncbi:MAG: hypothetical protein ACE5KQ_04985 [Thermoplasmata archaeon]